MSDGDHGRPGGVLSEAGEWDERYAGADRIWSGEPNGALVREVADLPPGRVLDVGCGEGADAVWLSSRGWDVTALDVSGVALDRARSHADAAGVAVTWLHSGLLDATLPDSGFDLVSAQYPALRRTPGDDAERALIGAVAPGGILLVVHHDIRDRVAVIEHGFHPDDWVGPRDVARLLGPGWEIEADEVRERVINGGSGAHHTHDVVLRARRAG
ncbi:class I SAM-dependent methyltransferase [Amycolatopsis pigmentata]|uniref:Class I SAM-dependent methyltransferase n=1 Tax=Amycolatopsis pigmentata TaxID=450801 RepID=A0ABW5FPT9_9PSEU